MIFLLAQFLLTFNIEYILKHAYHFHIYDDVNLCEGLVASLVGTMQMPIRGGRSMKTKEYER